MKVDDIHYKLFRSLIRGLFSGVCLGIPRRDGGSELCPIMLQLAVLVGSLNS